ncbi:glycine cleavage complex lipoylprotein [Microbacterium sp. 8M]|jgi:glycine cleavage system H protein|uniref:glycine cleavage system protein GcvH n=1 Tax=Microbacterium sp. 8M TaxID=2653153 RepID=UPI0012F26743|nr:glycine cleavage system protein GcvH [Microbacterium sp. 8M]VXC03405.1 glycine cleavage complex lipoylprotein [Microbacterium sp. 8M]
MTDLNTLRYSEEHEWVAVDGATATVGITDFAADALGDIVFVELPAVGTTLSRGDVFGEAESTKSVSELYAPVDGTVTEVNDAVVDDPALLNSSPFEDGWLIRVQVGEGATDGLLDRDAYVAHTEK